jgi:acyl-CoA thioester hydrolase
MDASLNYRIKSTENKFHVQKNSACFCARQNRYFTPKKINRMDIPMNEILAKFPIIYETSVAWGEMDALGHVNNIIYFRYFESARAKYFDAIGAWDYHKKHGIGMILHSTNCRFRRALQYPDKISVGAHVSDLQDDRYTMKYIIYSHAMKNVAAEGEGIIVVYDYNRNSKCLMPDQIRKKIQKLEAK